MPPSPGAGKPGAGAIGVIAYLDANIVIKPLDSLHLAAAVEHGYGLFLTNDVQLRRFPDITVEVLS
jgi:predicted nucleic acid-binding protein